MDKRAFVVIEDTGVALSDSIGAVDKRIVSAVQKALRENIGYWYEPNFLCARIFLAMVDNQKNSRQTCQFGITKWEHSDGEMVVAINCEQQTIVVSDSREDSLIDCSFADFTALSDDEIGA